MKEQNTGEVDGLRDAIARALPYLDDEFTPDNIREARGILHGLSATTEKTRETWQEQIDSIRKDEGPVAAERWALAHPDPRPAAQDADECKLDGCPHCGGEAYMVHGVQDGWVQCKKCGACGPRRSSDDEAARDWNRRPSIPMSAEVEKAVEYLLYAIVAWVPTKQQDYYRKQVDLIVAALKEKV
jgi:hypothetical protein